MNDCYPDLTQDLIQRYEQNEHQEEMMMPSNPLTTQDSAPDGWGGVDTHEEAYFNTSDDEATDSDFRKTIRVVPESAVPLVHYREEEDEDEELFGKRLTKDKKKQISLKISTTKVEDSETSPRLKKQKSL